MFDRKWMKPLALALSLPSTALGFAWFMHFLVTNGIITKGTGVIILVLVIANILVSMVFYAMKNNQKNKDK